MVSPMHLPEPDPTIIARRPAIVAGLRALGHQVDVLQDVYQDFGAGQFIWRLGNPAEHGYVAASDPRRDGLAAGW